MTREDVIAVLLANDKGPPDILRLTRAEAALYADCYLEYQTATANIAEHGLIVQRPRTGNPIENPYKKVRDDAHRKLAHMQNLDTSGLW